MNGEWQEFTLLRDRKILLIESVLVSDFRMLFDHKSLTSWLSEVSQLVPEGLLPRASLLSSHVFFSSPRTHTFQPALTFNLVKVPPTISQVKHTTHLALSEPHLSTLAHLCFHLGRKTMPQR